MVKPVWLNIIETHITENTRTQKKENILYVFVFIYLLDMSKEPIKKDEYIYGKNSAKDLKERV